MFESRRLFIHHAPFFDAKRLTALVGEAGSIAVVEMALRARRTHGRKERPSVFIAHHFRDALLAEQFIALLLALCPDIYVDWCDPAASPFQDSVTQRLVRARITEARKFILLASSAAMSSTRHQWELGLVTGIKPMSDIALVPLRDPKGAWPFIDHLGLYLRIVEDTPQAGKPPKQIVIGPDEMSLSLAEWLLP